MSLKPLTLRPGLNSLLTLTANAGGWCYGNLIRWKNGLLEKLGGWMRLLDQAADGRIRAMHAYQDLETNNNLLLGGDGGLQVFVEGGSGLSTIRFIDQIEEIAASSFVPDTGSTRILVTFPGHGMAAGEEFYLPITMSVGGVRLEPETYEVLAVEGPDQFSFNIATPALNLNAGTLPALTVFDTGMGDSTIRAATSPGAGFLMVIAGESGKVSDSADGFSWTARVANFGTSTVNAVLFASSTYVIVGGAGRICTAPSGLSTVWTARTSNVSAALNAIAFGGTRFMAVGSNVSSTSTNSGATWTANASAFAGRTMNGVAYNAGVFYAAGANGMLFSTADGAVWTQLAPGWGTSECLGLAFGNGFFLATFANGRIYRSTTGTTWVQQVTPAILQTSALRLSFTNGYFFILGPSGTAAITANGSAFTVIDVDHDRTVYAVAYGGTNSAYLAVGSTGSQPVAPATLTLSFDRTIWFKPAKVVLANHAYTVGSTFSVQVPTTLSSITFSGDYAVEFVENTSQFYINADVNPVALASATENAGNQQIYYFAGAPGIAENWFIDNLGNNAIISFTNSPLFVWTPPVLAGGLNIAIVVETAPSINAGMLVAMPQAQVVAFGASVMGVQDPLLLAWSDAGTYDVWGATSTNQAGTYRLSRGSLIVGSLQAPARTLVWTDIDLWSMEYVGPPFVYSFTIKGTGCGLIAPRARATIGAVTYWQGNDGFWRFDGGSVQPVDCPVWDYIFRDLDTANQGKCFAAANSSFTEISFYFPSLSGGTGEIDSYVKLNTKDGLWDTGRLVRSAWIDNSVLGSPLGADNNFRVQQHERGYDDDGEPMEDVWAMSGYFAIDGGDKFTTLNQLLPDMNWAGANGSVNFSFWVTDFPQAPQRMIGPFPVTPTTRYVRPKARGRLIGMRLDWGKQTGFNARLGAPSARFAPAGRQ